MEDAPRGGTIKSSFVVGSDDTAGRATSTTTSISLGSKLFFIIAEYCSPPLGELAAYTCAIISTHVGLPMSLRQSASVLRTNFSVRRR
jgi:hypothetical protein